MQYILYGAVRSQELRACVEKQIRDAGHELLFYIDDDKKNQSKAKNIYPFEKIAEAPNAAIVILCAAVQKVAEKIRAIGLNHQIFAAPLLGYRFICNIAGEGVSDFTETIYRFMKGNREELKTLYTLQDAYTRTILEERFAESEHFDFIPVEKYRNFIWQDYFSDATISPSGEITLLDCGAYIGDSAEAVKRIYEDRLKYIYAIEPDTDNMRIMRHSFEQNGLSSKAACFGCGIYDREGELRFTRVEDELELAEEGDIIVPVRTIDNILCDREIYGRLCIKMDCEGSECAALRGAKETIRRYRPYMAICLYHRMEDILEVPRTIRDICPEYAFYIRGGLHTECYAVPTK